MPSSASTHRRRRVLARTVRAAPAARRPPLRRPSRAEPTGSSRRGDESTPVRRCRGRRRPAREPRPDAPQRSKTTRPRGCDRGRRAHRVATGRAPSTPARARGHRRGHVPRAHVRPHRSGPLPARLEGARSEASGREVGGDHAQHRIEQLLPPVGAAQPDGNEGGADEHVGDVGELGEESRHPRVIRVGGRLVPPARAVVDRRRDESNRARIRCRFGNHRAGKRLARPAARCNVDAKRAVAPPERQLEVLVQLVAPPTRSRPDELCEPVVAVGGPRLIGEEALEELLHRAERGEVDVPERVAVRCVTAAGVRPRAAISCRASSRGETCVTLVTVCPERRARVCEPRHRRFVRNPGSAAPPRGSATTR